MTNRDVSKKFGKQEVYLENTLEVVAVRIPKEETEIPNE